MSDQNNHSLERPSKLYQADLIDIADEQLIYYREFWMFKHGKDVSEEVKDFIAFCRAENKEAMHCKRGGDSKSFFERREEAKKAVREKAKEFYEREKDK